MNTYEVITNAIIKKMEEGKIPWIKPWHSDKFMKDGRDQMFPCYSYSNGKRYNFINHMLLDFEPGEYATFPQIKKAGGKVKKGEKAQVICGWIVESKPQVDANGDAMIDDDGNPILKKTFALRYYNVFNILTQVEGIEPRYNWIKDEAEKKDHDAIEEAEKIITRYINSKDAPKFQIQKGSDEAYYSPVRDLVVIPDKSQYDVIEEYYSTAFHELTHSTMKKTRCDRKNENKKAAFGSIDYSKEELVAELGSCFLSNTAGLNSEKAFNNSVAYLQGWIKSLKDDPKMIVHASAAAEKAADYILNAQ